MNKEIGPKDRNKIRKALNELRKFELSKSDVNEFFSKLDRLPDRAEIPKLALLRESLLFKLENVKTFAWVTFSRPVPAVVGSAIILAFFAFMYSYAFLPQSPLLHDIKGTVKVFNSSKNEWVIAGENARIREGDIVKTFGNSRVDITQGALYSTRLRSDSELTVKRLYARVGRSNIRFFVDKGKAFTYFQKQRGKIRKKELEIETPQALTSVLGTDFMIHAMPAVNKTWVGVLDGVVKVTMSEIPKEVLAEEASVYVTSRHKTEVSKGAIPKKPERMMKDEWLEMEELYSIGRKPQVALLISTGPTRTRELLSLAPLFISDAEPSILPEKLMKIAETFDKAVREGSREKHIEAIRQFEDILISHPNPKYDVQFLLFIGSYYDYVGDYAKAISAFQNIVDKHSRSNLASIAQCAIGIIYEERLQNREAAIKAYQEVLSKYPRSPEAEEAKAGLKRLSS